MDTSFTWNLEFYPIKNKLFMKLLPLINHELAELICVEMLSHRTEHSSARGISIDLKSSNC
ncbi:hypothetical protein TSAR_009746 [Trichomalopsis sarcophagae]|uniref:Uncharacterized protein n=1 Tax=Trichomalopsis sarcophagae TaxID=543379 RepID=A0A232FJS5_9HYME|nr:hypothetical protein TSAR_009746 [Trichomalopsis sarcophagae]